MKNKKLEGLEDIYYLIEHSQWLSCNVLNKKLLKFEDYFPFNQKFDELEHQFQFAIRVLAQSTMLSIYIDDRESVSEIFQIHAALAKNQSILFLLATFEDIQRGFKVKDSRDRGVVKSTALRKEKANKRNKEIRAAAKKLLATGVERHSVAGILETKFNVKIDTIRRALKQKNTI